jgi:hypothetical protein
MHKFYVVDDDPMLIRHVHPDPDYIHNDGQWILNYASFVGGMIQGALQGCMLPAEVITYHQPDPAHPHSTCFLVAFDPVIMERLKRLSR